MKALRQVVDANTVCVVNSLHVSDPKVTGLSADMQRSGYQAPLEVRHESAPDNVVQFA